MPEALNRSTACFDAAQALVGCDFSSAPTAKKPIVLAFGHRRGDLVQLERLVAIPTLNAWGQWLQQPQCWLGAFDLPFGLPRELVATLGWPTQWHAYITHFCSLERAHIRAIFAAFCAARPSGAKFAHRATDIPAGSSTSMKWVNPPVAFMLHAGVARLLEAGIALAGLHAGASANLDTCGAPTRVALEGYPGLLAREVLGRRSYKSDDIVRQTPERLIARKDLITALEQGRTRLALRLRLSHAQRDALVDDARGDRLDAVLCLMQAAWAQRCRAAGDVHYGLPATMDPLEGWIITA